MTSLHTLDNGLRVVHDPGGPVPLVSVQLWFSVGSSWEPDALSGAAHLMEHMLFKSSEALPAGAAVERLEALGGAPNAWTSFEQTALYVSLPARHLEVAVETLAEMALRPRLDPEELVPERGVVLEEIREYKDDPEDVLANALRARVFGGHPYGRPILGTVASVSELDAARLRRFHDAHYQPSGAVLAVAGPVETERVLEVARRCLGGPAAPVRRAVPPATLTPARPGAFALDAGFDERLIEVAAPIPPLDHPDLPALDLLAVGLGQGGSSLLAQVLRHEKDLCMGCWAALENELAGGLFVAGLSAREGQTADAARALLALLARVSAEGLPLSVLRRARAAILSDRVRDRETVEGRASRAAWYIANRDDPAAELAYEAAIQRVRPADVQRVAARWLRPERWVVGAVAPADEVDTETLSAALAAVPRPAGPRNAVRPTRTRLLSCGARLLVEPDPSAEMMGISVVGVGGAIAAGARNAGLPAAWSALVNRGAGELDALDFAAALEDRACGLGAWSARSSSGIQVSGPGAECARLVELLGLVLCAPRFDPMEVARTRSDLTELSRTARDDAGELARLLSDQALFGGHPWGWPRQGTASSLGRLSPGRLRAFHRRVLCGANLVIGVSGAVDPGEVERLLERALRRLPVGAPVSVQPAILPARFHRRRTGVIPREGSPSEVVLTFPAPGQGAPEAPALAVLEAILSGVGGGSGRLFDRMREQEGLAYSVSATAAPGLGGGSLSCFVTADPARAGAAEAALWEELERLVSDGVEREELARVRTGLVERSLSGMQRALSRADHLAAAERYLSDGANWRARLEAPGRVTAAEVHALAGAVLRRDRCVTAVVGPEQP